MMDHKCSQCDSGEYEKFVTDVTSKRGGGAVRGVIYQCDECGHQEHLIEVWTKDSDEQSEGLE